MSKRTSIQSLPITDWYGRALMVDVMWVYPVGGLSNQAPDNPFYVYVTRVVYVVNGLQKEVTKFISKIGFKELEDEAVEKLVNEGVITSYNHKPE